MELQEYQALSETLQHFGLSKYESQVYVALLQSGASSVRELMLKCTVPRQKIYEVLKRLKQLGLADFLPGEPQKWIDLPPSEGSKLWDKLRDLEFELRQMRRALTDLRKLYESCKIREDFEKRDLWVIRNSRGVIAKLRELLDKATEEVILVLNDEGLNYLLNNCYDKINELSYNGVNILVLTRIAKKSMDHVKKLVDLCRVRHVNYMPPNNVCLVDNQEFLIFKLEEEFLGEGSKLVGMYSSELEILESLLFVIRAESGVSRDATYILSLLERGLLPEEALSYDASKFLNAALNYQVITSLTSALGKPEAYLLLREIGKRLLQTVSDRLSVTLTKGKLQDALKVISSLVFFYDGIPARIVFNEKTGILTCEFTNLVSSQFRLAAERGLDIFPSIWGLILLGLLDYYELEISRADAVFHPDENKWVIQYRLYKKRLHTFTEEERLTLQF